MRYRRNSDESLRELERSWQSDPSNIDTFLVYNLERRRNGLEPLIHDVPAHQMREFLESLLEPYFDVLSFPGTQFTVWEVKKSITDRSYATLERLISEITPQIIELGWIILIKSKRQVLLRIHRKAETNEWVVQWRENGRINDNKSYFTDDRQDAEATMRDMERRIPLAYPEFYVLSRNIIQPSGYPIRNTPQGELVADQWQRYEDPRSLDEPQYRRGSYPVRTILVRVKNLPGSTTPGAPENWAQTFKPRPDTYITWRYIIPYEGDRTTSFDGGHYDMTMEQGYVDYLVRLLKLDTSSDYRLINSV
jgi:hypothetical protein